MMRLGFFRNLKYDSRFCGFGTHVMMKLRIMEGTKVYTPEDDLESWPDDGT